VSEETLLKFPCEFPIKVMGKNEVSFEKIVADTILIHAPDFDAGSLSVRESNGGKFLAVTAVFTATSKAQVDAIYLALSKHPSVLMAL
jgi:uncharacterized protein